MRPLARIVALIRADIPVAELDPFRRAGADAYTMIDEAPPRELAAARGLERVHAPDLRRQPDLGERGDRLRGRRHRGHRAPALQPRHGLAPVRPAARRRTRPTRSRSTARTRSPAGTRGSARGRSSSGCGRRSRRPARASPPTSTGLRRDADGDGTSSSTRLVGIDSLIETVDTLWIGRRSDELCGAIGDALGEGLDRDARARPAAVAAVADRSRAALSRRGLPWADDELRPAPGEAPAGGGAPRGARGGAAGVRVRRPALPPGAGAGDRRARDHAGGHRHACSRSRSRPACTARATAASATRCSRCRSGPASTRPPRPTTRSSARRTSTATGSRSPTWARDAVVLALPDKILCRPDCAGPLPRLRQEPERRAARARGGDRRPALGGARGAARRASGRTTAVRLQCRPLPWLSRRGKPRSRGATSAGRRIRSRRRA